jgi:uncharacterized membrane protein YqiK
MMMPLICTLRVVGVVVGVVIIGVVIVFGVRIVTASAVAATIRQKVSTCGSFCRSTPREKHHAHHCEKHHNGGYIGGRSHRSRCNYKQYTQQQ